MIHQIKIHENPTSTSDAAPYIGTYVERDTAGLDTLSHAIAKESGLPPIMTRAIIESEFESIAELERESLVRANFDGFAVCAAIMGSLPTSDAEFDPAHNRFVLAIRLDDSLRLALVNVTPSIVTDATTKRVAINEVSDIAEPRPYSVLHGQRQFLVTGYNLVLTDEGAELFMQGKHDTRHALVVDEAADPQKIKAHTAELLEPGDYKVVIKSRGGDAEGLLQTHFKRVKYLKVVNPHRMDSFVQEEPRLEPGEICFSGEKPIVVTGQNLADVESVKILTYPDGYDSGPDPIMVLDELENITATDTTLSVLNKVNSTPEPDGAYWGIDARIVATWADGQTAYINAKFHDDSE